MSTDPFGLVTAKVDSFVDGLFYQLPNVLAGLALLLVAWIGGRMAASLIRQVAQRRSRPDLGVILGSLIKGTIIVVAVLMAAAIVFPSVKPADILGTLGIGSVAIGFAFRDILQNLLAGLLLLVRRPFGRGDQIIVKDYEGTVEHIEGRATYIKTYDGQRVIIPNSEIYTSPVIVNTAYEVRRDEYDVGIGYGDDPAAASKLFTSAVSRVEGVLQEPAPESLPWELAASTVNLKVRWWTHATRSDQVHVRARVILSLFQTAKDHAMDLAFPTQVVLLHDQTESSDGNRAHHKWSRADGSVGGGNQSSGSYRPVFPLFSGFLPVR